MSIVFLYTVTLPWIRIIASVHPQSSYPLLRGERCMTGFREEFYEPGQDEGNLNLPAGKYMEERDMN